MIRKLISTFIILALGGTIVGLVYVFVLQPQVTISGPVKSVTVYQGNTANIVDRFSSPGKFRLTTGTYTVELEAQNGSLIATSLKLGLTQRQSVTVPSNAPELGSSTLIANLNGLEPTIANNGMNYLDVTKNIFAHLGLDGTTQPILPAQLPLEGMPTASQISPLPKANELLTTSDNIPYSYTNGSISQLSLAGIDTSNLNGLQVLFGSNANNSDFVMSVGQNVYHYSSVSSSPVLIATIKTRFDRLRYGGGKFLAFDNSLPYTKTDLASLYAQQYLVYPVLGSVNTKTLTQLPMPVVDASLSPNGSQMVVTYRQRSSAELVNITTLHPKTISEVPRPSTLAPLWLSNVSFVYVASGAIWQYDTTTETATGLTKVALFDPSSMSLQPDGSILYSVQNPGSQAGGGIYKVTANSSATASDETDLEQLLFNTSLPVKPYYLRAYTNFGTPTFLLGLTYPPGGNSITADQAIASFANLLLQKGLDPKQFTISATFLQYM